jgi:sugar phosphate isomerase/epimerase
MGNLPFALQLYTVRDHLEQDFPGTLERVKEIGYDCVELAGYGSYTPAECKQLLDDIGLIPVSAHVGLHELSVDASSVIETLQTVGVKYAPLSAGADSEDDWREIARALEAAGAMLRAAGITLCYHNHAHEFEKIGDQYILDFLFDATKPDHLAAQIDTYWVKYGGEDPVAFIKKYAGRCPLLHIKDMTADEDPTFAEVGQGIIDWGPVFAAGAEAGVEWYIVEQDTCTGDSIDSARISAEFMAAR